jgi:hypothetical protein
MYLIRVCLAARIDRCRESQDGSAGQIFLNDIQKKLDKAQEPPPGKNAKALPIPDEGPKKRRAGKRCAFRLILCSRPRSWMLHVVLMLFCTSFAESVD